MATNNDDSASPGGQSEGKQGYYYLQGQRINVSRRDDLIAVRFHSRAPVEAISDFSESRSTDLEPSDEFREMQGENLRIFRVSTTRAADVSSLADDLMSQENVDKVGDVYVDDNGRGLVLTDELVVRFQPDMTSDQIETLKNTYGLETAETLGFSDNAYVLRVKPGSGRTSLEIANELLNGEQAVYAYPNWIEYIGYRMAFAVAEPEERHGYHPNDPLFAQQWQHQTINTHTAWLTEQGSSNISLAVVDGGVDITHEDINSPGKIQAPIDLMVTPPDSNPTGNNHGTFVAGMAVAIQDNNLGVSGSAPNCRLIPIKAGDTMQQVRMAQGFQYAADNGADVITCSLGPVGSWPMTDALRDAIDYATTYGRNGRGCVYTQAVDNSPNPVSLDQVSSYERSIAVSRTNNADHYDGAAMGPELDICAPGVQVWSTVNMNTAVGTVGYNVQPSVPGAANGHYASSNGTSFATPLTAGVACLILSRNAGLSWEEVRQILLDSADKIDAAANPYNPAPAGRPPGIRNDRYGYGRLNAQSAVQLAQAGSARDLYIRDTISDSGTVPQPAWGFWDSPDIWVRNIDDGGTNHQSTVRGLDNYLHARVWNRGTQASLPCWVRFYITTWAGTEFRYPYDFKPDTTAAVAGGTAGNLRPRAQFPAPATYLVGVQRIDSIPAGGNAIAKVLWESALIPPAQNWHPCLLVEISPHDGPAPAGQYVWENNNLGQKNITIVDVHRGQFIEFPYRFSHINARDPFVTLDIQKLKAPRGLQIFLDVKRPQMLEAIAKAAGVAISTVPLTPVLPVTPEMPVVPVAPIASLHSDVPWRLTFLEETRIAMSSGGDRAENDGFVVTFPSGSSVDVGIGRAEVTAPENRIETLALSGESEDKEATRASTAARPMFSVAALEGRKVLAFNPALKLAKVKVPLARPGFQESSLKIRVPENAVPGDNYIFDVAERNSKGRLVGGVRLQVHVVE
jgi:subtilisin family serine protease